MENQVQVQNIKIISRKKKIIVIAIIIFIAFFIVGYISGTMVSYEEKWFGAGPSFWGALKPF